MAATDQNPLTNFLAFFRCLREGHIWKTSRRRPGYKTCMRCNLRTRIR